MSVGCNNYQHCDSGGNSSFNCVCIITFAHCVEVKRDVRNLPIDMEQWMQLGKVRGREGKGRKRKWGGCEQGRERWKNKKKPFLKGPHLKPLLQIRKKGCPIKTNETEFQKKTRRGLSLPELLLFLTNKNLFGTVFTMSLVRSSFAENWPETSFCRARRRNY